MTLDTTWISEACEDIGSAFSLKCESTLHDEKSAFQQIAVYRTAQWGNLMLIDGCTMVSTRDNFLYHEMMSHPALYTHPAPRHIAIIGGGDCGTLLEVLKHKEIEQATQIDIDERVTRIAEAYFPELCAANSDPRAELMFVDGIKWVKEAEPGSLDIIIADSTDPRGPGEVLFTADFYAACHAALREHGLVVQQSESPLAHAGIQEGMYRDLYRAGFSDIRTLFFPQPIYPTGWWTATLGSKGGNIADFRKSDVENRTFETRYYNTDIHLATFAAPEFFKKSVTEWRRRYS